jgi:pimeloyl-ACP methyl ester carboxylesterase
MFDQPPSSKTYFVDLPLSRLHIMEVGSGEPLIIVPATISELNEWRSLAQFMAQWFRVYFFELPGHGRSTPLRERFSSHQVAHLVEQLVDELGFERFNLLGFSFGGILAMQAFKRLHARIDRLGLIAPCLGHRSLHLSPSRQYWMRHFIRFLGIPIVQRRFYDLVHRPRSRQLIVKTVQKIGHLERTIPLERKLGKITMGTIEVLNAQVQEILTMRFKAPPTKYDVPCYFAMSIYDPLVHFDTSLDIVHEHFTNVNIARLTYPFHQPPIPFTYEELNRDLFETVAAFMNGKG